MDKKCNKCGKTKSVKQFSKCKSKKDGLQANCKQCKNALNKKHYNNNKELYYNKNKKHRKIARQFVYDYLKTNACIDCGETEPACLDFDHISDKTGNVAQLINNGIGRVKKEIAKCVLRCANCHRKKTANERNWYSDLE